MTILLKVCIKGLTNKYITHTFLWRPEEHKASTHVQRAALPMILICDSIQLQFILSIRPPSRYDKGMMQTTKYEIQVRYTKTQLTSARDNYWVKMLSFFSVYVLLFRCLWCFDITRTRRKCIRHNTKDSNQRIFKISNKSVSGSPFCLFCSVNVCSFSSINYTEILQSRKNGRRRIIIQVIQFVFYYLISNIK